MRRIGGSIDVGSPDTLWVNKEVQAVKVLIVQDNADLGQIWCRFLERQGISSDLATTEADAIDLLRAQAYDALVLEPVLVHESGFAVADFATMRYPDISIIAVTKSSFFSDGSVFQLIPNARGLLRLPLRPDDLAAFLEHCDRKNASNLAQRKSIA